MSEKPILFTGPMVRAILEGRKTMTRRVVKPQPEYRENESVPGHFGTWFHGWNLDHPNLVVDDYIKHCPYRIGMKLWVRETFREFDKVWSQNSMESAVQYRVDMRSFANGREVEQEDVHGKWRPSIFMPRWASRITLEVVSVRCERLQDITEEDALAEGIYCVGCSPHKDWTEARFLFRELWDSINKVRGYSWDINPWTWIIEFKKL